MPKLDNKVIILTITALFLLAIWLIPQAIKKPENSFNGELAYNFVEYQVALGPRTPGSNAHANAVSWIGAQLSKSGWMVEIQETKRMGQSINNVIGKMGVGQPWIILGAHYDSRLFADRDPNFTKRNLPVPGANDGASGVAVLLELSRVIPQYLDNDELNVKEIWLVFFDAEDNGNIPGWDWILGSQAFADELNGDFPDTVVIVDMVGDVDLNLYFEHNSDSVLSSQIWMEAAKLGYSNVFIPVKKHRVIDDHIPFLNKGIPAVDIIDIDYQYWHTTGDTTDKISSKSLDAVGETLLAWLAQ